jgi:hypothetical protein
MLARGNETEVARGEEHAASGAGNHPEHRNAAHRFDGFPHDALVAGSGDLVDDDTGDADIGVQSLTSQHQCGHRARHLAGVDYQHHRSLQAFGQFRCAMRPTRIRTVVQTTVAFDQVESAGHRVAGEGIDDALEPHQVGIQISGGLLGSPFEPGRVYVVRPLLECAGWNASPPGFEQERE